MKSLPLLLLLWAAPALAATYAIEDIRPNIVFYPSLVVGGGGEAHLAYYYVSSSDGAGVGYSHRVGGGWTTEVVAPEISSSVSLALDASGIPHVAYVTAASPTVRYASLAGGVWTSEDVDLPTDQSGDLSLAFDATGVPHVAYPWGGTLRHAWKPAGAATWSTETIDAALGTSGYPGTSLRFDAQGRAAVSYHRGTQLVFALREPGGWSQGVIPGAAYVGTSLAFDAAGRAWIASTSGSGVQLAHEQGGTWLTEIVDPGGGGEVTLRFDGAGAAHLSWYGGTDGSLHYARRAAGGAWDRSIVDDRFRSGQSAAMALDAAGTPSFAFTFRGYVGGTLRYAQAQAAVSVDVPAGLAFSFATPAPNPSRGGAGTFAFALPREALVSLRLFDASGRLLASRMAAAFPVGPSTVRWDPGVLAPGTYFVRLRASTGESAERRWTVL
jgi:hypothetical protein